MLHIYTLLATIRLTLLRGVTLLAESAGFPFEPVNFVENLKYMGIGLLGVFMIIAIIMAATYGIMHFTSKKKNDDK